MGFNELQQQVKEFDARFGWTCDKPENTLIHMMEELGEVSSHILHAVGYRKSPPSKDTVADEIADLLYLTLKLSNLLGVDLDEAWGRVEKRYSKK